MDFTDAAHVAANIPIETEDLECMGPDQWLTDSAVRHIVLEFGNHGPDSKINFVDPSWLRAWDFGSPRPVAEQRMDTPEFLWGDPEGLAIPYNLNGNHWVVILVSLVDRKAVLYDSLMDSHASASVRGKIQRFFDIYQHFFYGQGQLTWEDGKCAQQGDYSACGVYTCLNLISLLNHSDPRTMALSKEEEKKFRIAGYNLLYSKL